MAALYQLNALTKDFSNGSIKFKALRGIDLKIDAGDFVALTGPSGSGKSTLLNILGMIEEPSSGNISFAGHSLNSATNDQLTKLRRKAVGFIFQNFNLMPILSAVENVEYVLHLDEEIPKSEIRERALRALDALAMKEFADHKPAELSGGQRQRVAIARAIVKNPAVIIADEPTANLDSKTAKQIMDLIHDLNQSWGSTVIVATHDQGIAKAAGKVVNIRDGVIKK